MATNRLVRLIAITVACALVGSFQIYNQAIVNNLIPAFAPWLTAVHQGDDDIFDWYDIDLMCAFPLCIRS
jgi:hypothetical protein